MEEQVTFDDPRPVKLTVDDFAVLHEAGALEGYRHAELIDGVITEMSPQTRRHSFAIGELFYRLRRLGEAAGASWAVLPAPTVALPPHDAPEPDLVLVNDDRGDRYVRGETVLLAIEVSVTTLRHDLTIKRNLYAAHGIPELWIVDVEGGIVHQFWDAAQGHYAESRSVPVDSELRSATMPDLVIDGSGIV